MTGRDHDTLRAIFRKPPPGDLPWDDLESMLRGVGVAVKARGTTRVALVKGGEVMVLRRPHPKPIAIRATARDVAAFLRAAGVTP